LDLNLLYQKYFIASATAQFAPPADEELHRQKLADFEVFIAAAKLHGSRLVCE
jgi:hypothetical protein